MTKEEFLKVTPLCKQAFEGMPYEVWNLIPRQDKRLFEDIHSKTTDYCKSVVPYKKNKPSVVEVLNKVQKPFAAVASQDEFGRFVWPELEKIAEIMPPYFPSLTFELKKRPYLHLLISPRFDLFQEAGSYENNVDQNWINLQQHLAKGRLKIYYTGIDNSGCYYFQRVNWDKGFAAYLTLTRLPETNYEIKNRIKGIAGEIDYFIQRDLDGCTPEIIPICDASPEFAKEQMIKLNHWIQGDLAPLLDLKTVKASARIIEKLDSKQITFKVLPIHVQTFSECDD